MQRWKPNVTVAAVVEQDGRFLIVEEQTSDGIRFNQPAGHLEAGESLVDAVIRETLEETACWVSVEALVGIYQWRRAPHQDSYLRFTFSCRLLGVEGSRALDHGIIATHWLDLPELRARAGVLRSPLVLESTEAYLAGQRASLDLLSFRG